MTINTENSQPVYQAENLSLKRNGRQVLENVSVEIFSGKMTALIGPNSAGKTTLLDVLLDLVSCDSGSRKLKDKQLQRWKREELATTIAYLPQNHEAHWAIAVYDYVALGRIPYQTGSLRISENDRDIIDRAIISADIEHLLDRPVTELSGGELARVALARTLAVDADILLVDEPVAGLDPGHQLSVMNLLKQQAASGKAVVTVMHDLVLAGRFCDHVWLLDAGKLIESGKPEQVISDQNLRAVYKVSSHLVQSEPTPIIMPWENI